MNTQEQLAVFVNEITKLDPISFEREIHKLLGNRDGLKILYDMITE